MATVLCNVAVVLRYSAFHVVLGEDGLSYLRDRALEDIFGLEGFKWCTVALVCPFRGLPRLATATAPSLDLSERLRPPASGHRF